MSGVRTDTVSNKFYSSFLIWNWRNWQLSALRIMRWPRIGWQFNFGVSLARPIGLDRFYLGFDLVWLHCHLHYAKPLVSLSVGEERR